MESQGLLWLVLGRATSASRLLQLPLLRGVQSRRYQSELKSRLFGSGAGFLLRLRLDDLGLGRRQHSEKVGAAPEQLSRRFKRRSRRQRQQLSRFSNRRIQGQRRDLQELMRRTGLGRSRWPSQAAGSVQPVPGWCTSSPQLGRQRTSPSAPET